LERDTTHLTYELGRYLLGAGVLSEITAHYAPILKTETGELDVGAALTVENGPAAEGSGSQYDGAVNEELLAIIREAISSPGVFRQSAYVTDPLDGFVRQLQETVWDLKGVKDQESALSAIREQVMTQLEGGVDFFEVEMKQFESAEDFTVNVSLRHGYSVQKFPLVIHTCQYEAVITAPTCTEQGYTTYTCVCGDSYVGAPVDALGHTYSSDRDGTCDRCGEKRTVYSALRGSVKSSRDGAVVTLRGAAAYETAVSNGTFDFDAVEQGSYDLAVKQAGCLTYTVKGITVGEADVLLPEIELIAGDVNGDDMINIMDIGTFRENFGMAEEEITNAHTDVNGDDMVNIIDMGIFRRNFGMTAGKDCTAEYIP